MTGTKFLDKRDLANKFLDHIEAKNSNSTMTYDVISTIHVTDADFDANRYSVPAGSREYIGKTVETNSGRKKAKDIWDMIPSGQI